MSKEPYKPTREELLQELESIRTTLLPEIGVSTDNEPAHNDIRENSNDVSLAVTLEIPIVPTPSQAVTETTAIDATAVTEATPPQDYEEAQELEEANMSVLPGQQSLFDEPVAGDKPIDSASATQHGSNIDDTNTIEAPSNAQSAERTKSTDMNDNPENPFLPKHMKERLEKEKSLYQQEIDATTMITRTKTPPNKAGAEQEPSLHPHGTRENIGRTNDEVVNEQDQLLINELVEMYMPKIEEELRHRLEARLSGQTEHLNKRK